MNNAEQQFLNELDNKFWKAADKLRANMDAANDLPPRLDTTLS